MNSIVKKFDSKNRLTLLSVIVTKNEQLLRSIDSKCEHIRTLEERLNYANVTVKKYEKQREQLNQLQIEHAQINTELIMCNKQAEELKAQINWLMDTLNTTSNTLSSAGSAQTEEPGSLIESIQNGEMG